MRTLGLLLIAAIATISSTAQADMATGVNKPLLIVRFNQPNVYFERALKQAVTSAESAKPGVVYEVVSLVPVNGRSADANAKDAASFNVSTVTSFMQQLGVPASRIQASSQPSGDVTAQELQIFVR